MNELPKSIISSAMLAQYEANMRSRWMMDAVFFGWNPPKPLTRWVRITRRVEDYGERIALAWRVLKGDDIHEDCY